MSSKPFEFEKSLTQLEAITTWLESSDADLDQGIAKFERGMELSQELRAHLTQIENRIEKIRQKFEAPTATTATALETADKDDQAGLF
jgi:exodeoxyribonuclease VII small subunit